MDVSNDERDGPRSDHEEEQRASTRNVEGVKGAPEGARLLHSGSGSGQDVGSSMAWSYCGWCRATLTLAPGTEEPWTNACVGSAGQYWV